MKDIEKKVLEIVTTMTVDFDSAANAENISNLLTISRNRTSSILNELFKKKLLVKINSRPVLFFDKKYLEKKYNIQLTKNIFKNLAELKANFYNDLLEKIIGHDGSLQNLIFQCKAAVAYSNNGLPIMFIGESGTGKTFIAKNIYRYSIERSIIARNAPFLHINCSEYANNPELFLANLFGSVKGAYTGAYKDNKGILEEADGGYLFFDEIHALNKSCQEKLFQFMDDGNFHHIGDNEKWYHADVRLLFATTEYSPEYFLTTFLRRIPVILNVPSLSERSTVEKIQIISFLLAEEEISVNKNIILSERALNFLLAASFKGNVGELRNLITLAVANQSFQTSENDISLTLTSFTYEESEPLMVPEDNFYAVAGLNSLVASQQDNRRVLEKISHLINEQIKNKQTDISDLKTFWELLEKIDIQYSEVRTNEQQIIDTELNNIFYQVETTNIHGYFSFSKKTINFHLLTDLFLLFCNRQNYNFFKELNTQTTYMISMLNHSLTKEKKIVDYVIQRIEKLISLKNNSFCQLLLFSFIDYYSISSTQNERIGFIMAHGDNIASEIANSMNNMLNSYIFEGIDLPLDASVKEAVLILKEKIAENKNAQKIAILTDMGSLAALNLDEFKQQTDYIVLNSINPPFALTIGNDLLQDKPLKLIKQGLLECHDSFYIHIYENQRKPAVVCSCASGSDTDKKISDIIRKAFPNNHELEILTVDYEELLTKQTQENLFNLYKVNFLIGTLDPGINNLSFISVGDLIANDTNQLLHYLLKDLYSDKEISEITRNLLNEFTLTNLINELTILNPDKLLKTVTTSIDLLQQKLGFSIPINTCFGLYIHTCCMIERLIRTKETDTSDDNDHQQLDTDFKQIFEDSFYLVEKYYSVSIPEEEIHYIKDYIYME